MRDAGDGTMVMERKDKQQQHQPSHQRQHEYQHAHRDLELEDDHREGDDGFALSIEHLTRDDNADDHSAPDTRYDICSGTCVDGHDVTLYICVYIYMHNIHTYT